MESTFSFLSHKDTALHDYEIDMGVDRALCLQLGYLDMLVSSSSPTNATTAVGGASNNNNSTSFPLHQHPEEDQIGLICRCLTRIYQCSSDRRQRSFQEIGASDLVPILVKILKRYNNNTQQPQQQQANNFETLVPLFQIFRIFAKLDANAKSSLIRWKNGRLILTLMDSLNTLLKSGSISSNHHQLQPQQSLTVVISECIGVLKDLSFRLEEADKSSLHKFVNKDGLLSRTMEAFSLSQQQHHLLIIMELIAAIYWNFATSNKISLKMAQDPGVLRNLDKLLHCCDNNNNNAMGNKRKAPSLDNGQQGIRIKRNALSALGNIAVAITAEKQQKHSSLTLPSPQQLAAAVEDQKEEAVDLFLRQHWIRPTLLHLVQNETDEDIQRRAMRTIRCLASCSRGRKLLLGPSEGSSDLESFITSLLTTTNDGGKHLDNATRVHVCETICYFTHDQEMLKSMGPTLETIMVQIISAFKNNQPGILSAQASFIAAICKALFFSLERSPWQQRGDSFFPLQFFEGLFSCSRVEQEVTHPPLARLLLTIGKELQRNVDRQKAFQGTTILTKPALDTIAELLEPVGPSFEQSRRDALHLTQLFLKNSKNKKALAENERLLSAVVGFALMTRQDDEKNLAKKMILELVPEL